MKAIKLLNHRPHPTKHDIKEEMIWSNHKSKNQIACSKFIHLAVAQLCEQNDVDINYFAKATKKEIQERYSFGSANSGFAISAHTSKVEQTPLTIESSKLIELVFSETALPDKIEDVTGKVVKLKSIKEFTEFMVTRFDFKPVSNKFNHLGKGKYLSECSFVYQRHDSYLTLTIRTVASYR